MSSHSNRDQSSLATSPTLLENVRRENQEAWLRLVDCYTPRLLARCQARGLDYIAAQDVLQETWLSVSKSIGSFESSPGRGAFRAWIHRILLRRIADYRRRMNDAPVVSRGYSVLGRIPEMPGTSVSSRICEEASSVNATSENHREGGWFGATAGNGSSPELMQHIAAIRSSVDVRTWKIFTRSVVDGIASEVIANEFSVTPANVRQIRSRLLRRLRKLPEKEG